MTTADETIKQGEWVFIDKIAQNLQLKADDITCTRYRAKQKLELNIT